MNELSKISKKLTFYHFADDTKIYFESSDLLHLQNTINKEICKVRKWSEFNQLVPYTDKTNFAIFHSAAQKLTEHIVIDRAYCSRY